MQSGIARGAIYSCQGRRANVARHWRACLHLHALLPTPKESVPEALPARYPLLG